MFLYLSFPLILKQKPYVLFQTPVVKKYMHFMVAFKPDAFGKSTCFFSKVENFKNKANLSNFMKIYLTSICKIVTSIQQIHLCFMKKYSLQQIPNDFLSTRKCHLIKVLIYLSIFFELKVQSGMSYKGKIRNNQQRYSIKELVL